MISKELILNQFSKYYRSYINKDYKQLEIYLTEDRKTKNDILKIIDTEDDDFLYAQFVQNFVIFNKLLSKKNDEPFILDEFICRFYNMLEKIDKKQNLEKVNLYFSTRNTRYMVQKILEEMKKDGYYI